MLRDRLDYKSSEVFCSFVEDIVIMQTSDEDIIYFIHDPEGIVDYDFINYYDCVDWDRVLISRSSNVEKLKKEIFRIPEHLMMYNFLSLSTVRSDGLIHLVVGVFGSTQLY